jgi:hypothetical protein
VKWNGCQEEGEEREEGREESSEEGRQEEGEEVVAMTRARVRWNSGSFISAVRRRREPGARPSFSFINIPA